MNAKFGFIADGYTLDHMIPETEFYPEVNITFRPATPTERSTNTRKVINLDKNDRCADAEKEAAEFIAKHLKSWDLMAPPVSEGAEPQPVEITVNNILRLESHLSGELYSVVLGEKPAVAKQVEADTKN